MPQMMPLLWLILLCYTFILQIILIAILYFFFQPNLPSKPLPLLINGSMNDNKNIKIWWKWQW